MSDHTEEYPGPPSPDNTTRGESTPEPHREEVDERTSNGRTVSIDTGYYNVQVWGDPDDSFDEVLEASIEAAEHAKRDVESLNDQMDTDDCQYR